MHRRNAVLLSATAIVLIAVPAFSQATWEGPTGAFLNPFALTLGEEQGQVSLHFLDLQPVGSLTTVGGAFGGDRWEAGLTRANLSAGGGSQDTDILHAKWIALPFKGESPQVAVGAIIRNAHGSSDTNDVYVAATKIIPADVPIIASLTVRNTNGLASGLMGKSGSRTTEFGGFAGLQVRPDLIVGLEYYEQPRTSPWRQLCVRWAVSPGTALDVGVGWFSEGWTDQVAVGLTHSW